MVRGGERERLLDQRNFLPLPRLLSLLDRGRATTTRNGKERKEMSHTHRKES